MLKLIWVISYGKHRLKNLQQTNKNDEGRMITALIEGIKMKSYFIWQLLSYNESSESL